MDEDTAKVGILLQKLEAAKVAYIANLNEAHSAVIASLQTGTQNAEDGSRPVHTASRINTQDKVNDLLQTERDPLACEAYYTDRDLKEFLDDLDAQLRYERLEPASTGKGFIAVCNGRVMDAFALKESIMKLLNPLPALILDADDGRLHYTRVINSGWAFNDRIVTYNAVWFTFLDGDHAGSWNLYHDAVAEEHPQNFWELVRVSVQIKVSVFILLIC